MGKHSPAVHVGIIYTQCRIFQSGYRDMNPVLYALPVFSFPSGGKTVLAMIEEEHLFIGWTHEIMGLTLLDFHG